MDTTSIKVFIETKVLPEYRPIVSEIRDLIKETAPDVTEEMRGGTEAYYSVPAYRLKRIIMVISPSKQGITLAFSKGASFEDSYGLLEGVGKQAKNVRMKTMDDFNKEALVYYIGQAVEKDRV